jgi:hypothetical protein
VKVPGGIIEFSADLQAEIIESINRQNNIGDSIEDISS